MGKKVITHPTPYENLLRDSAVNAYGAYVLIARQSFDFNFERARNKLIDLDICDGHGPEVVLNAPGEVPAGYDPDDDIGITGRKCKLLRLAQWINLESRITVCEVFL